MATDIGAKFTDPHPPSHITLAFQNGLEYRNDDWHLTVVMILAIV